jgi:predicted RNA binding protein YcfA (HicA-like mRNA interferase family)
MTGKEVLRVIRSLGGEEVRQKGSHVRIKLGTCTTTVPVHAGEDLRPGTLHRIERDLEPCLWPGWLTGR